MMSTFLQGFMPGWPGPKMMELTPEQIREAQMSYEIDIKQLNQLLDDHEVALTTTENFLAAHVAKQVDPQQLQAIADRIKGHTSRLAALMEKFPVVP